VQLVQLAQLVQRMQVGLWNYGTWAGVLEMDVQILVATTYQPFSLAFLL
jgi:hypothetical protein